MNKDEIKAIRKAYGMTQAEFAKLLIASVLTISKWENGHCTPHKISINILKRLADKLQEKNNEENHSS